MTVVEIDVLISWALIPDASLLVDKLIDDASKTLQVVADLHLGVDAVLVGRPHVFANAAWLAEPSIVPCLLESSFSSVGQICELEGDGVKLVVPGALETSSLISVFLSSALPTCLAHSWPLTFWEFSSWCSKGVGVVPIENTISNISSEGVWHLTIFETGW